MFLMANKKTREPKQNRSDRVNLARALEALHREKITDVVPVKVPSSLKNCLIRIAGRRGVSTWIRQAIIEKLERLARERGGP